MHGAGSSNSSSVLSSVQGRTGPEGGRTDPSGALHASATMLAGGLQAQAHSQQPQAHGQDKRGIGGFQPPTIDVPAPGSESGSAAGDGGSVGAGQL